MSSDRFVTTSLAGQASYDAEQNLQLDAESDPVHEEVTMQMQCLTNAFCIHDSFMIDCQLKTCTSLPRVRAGKRCRLLIWPTARGKHVLDEAKQVSAAATWAGSPVYSTIACQLQTSEFYSHLLASNADEGCILQCSRLGRLFSLLESLNSTLAAVSSLVSATVLCLMSGRQLGLEDLLRWFSACTQPKLSSSATTGSRLAQPRFRRGVDGAIA
jgi:hypothetical protein